MRYVADLFAMDTEMSYRRADVVGGIPWIEHTDADAKAHVDAMVCLAQRTNRRVAMLVDDAGDGVVPGVAEVVIRVHLLVEL